MYCEADLPDRIRHLVIDDQCANSKMACRGSACVLQGGEKMMPCRHCKLKPSWVEPGGIHHMRVAHEDFPEVPEGNGEPLGGGAISTCHGHDGGGPSPQWDVQNGAGMR